MIFTKISSVSLLLAMASLIHGSPSSNPPYSRSSSHRLATAAAPKDMVVTSLYTSTTTSTCSNRYIVFYVTDQNSNSSIACSTTWLESPNNTSTVPTSDIECGIPTGQETWSWSFGSYTNLGNFTLSFKHQFQDDVNYSPPWDFPTYYALSNPIQLTCTSGGTLTGCYQPKNALSVNVPVNSVSD